MSMLLLFDFFGDGQLENVNALVEALEKSCLRSTVAGGQAHSEQYLSFTSLTFHNTNTCM